MNFFVHSETCFIFVHRLLLINQNMLMNRNIFLTNFILSPMGIYEKKSFYTIEKKFFSKLFFSQYCSSKFDHLKKS